MVGSLSRGMFTGVTLRAVRDLYFKTVPSNWTEVISTEEDCGIQEQISIYFQSPENNSVRFC